MNTNIKTLIDQVGTDVSGKWVRIDNTEKLAELIVQECVSLCTKQVVGAVGTHASAHNRAVMYCRDAIKEHFGVKE